MMQLSFNSLYPTAIKVNMSPAPEASSRHIVFAVRRSFHRFGGGTKVRHEQAAEEAFCKSIWEALLAFQHPG